MANTDDPATLLYINDCLLAAIRAIIAATGLPPGSTVENAITEIERLREFEVRGN